MDLNKPMQKWLERGNWLTVGLGMLLMGCASAATDVAPVSHPPVSSSPIVQATAPLAQSLPISAIGVANGQQVRLEVAQTPQQQAIGLMGRTSLADDRGMIFPFNPPRPVQFWMKNTLISLDMIFLRKGVIKAIATNVPPCQADPCPTYGPGTETIDQVVEVRGGRSKELNLKVGDRFLIQPVKVNQLK